MEGHTQMVIAKTKQLIRLDSLPQKIKENMYCEPNQIERLQKMKIRIFPKGF